MAGYLLDTNHASKFLNGEESLRGRIESARQTGDHVGISVTVLGELYYAAYASKHRGENVIRLLAT